MNSVKSFKNDMTSAQHILQWIKNEHPEWIEEDGSCKRCEEYYRIMNKLVKSENVYC